MDYYKGVIPIIDDSTAPDVVDLANPKGVGKGYEERDYKLYPQEMFASPDEMKLYDESEWDAIFDMQEETKSSLEHLYLQGIDKPVFPNLKQGQDGYCWGYSTGHAAMLLRLIMNQPLLLLNPHSVCAIIKGGANQGGWCGLSAKFLREVGIGVAGSGPGQWPLLSRDLRYDTPEFRANAALHKVTEDWVDLTKQVYDQNLTAKQIATCLFNNIPVPQDFNGWGHSVCGIRKVRVEPGSWGTLILNSWPESWSKHNLAVLRGSKAMANGAVALRVSTASVK